MKSLTALHGRDSAVHRAVAELASGKAGFRKQISGTIQPWESESCWCLIERVNNIIIIIYIIIIHQLDNNLLILEK